MSNNSASSNYIMTPACPCLYAHLAKPATNFDPDGVYEVDLVMKPRENPEHHAFMTQLKALLPEGTNTLPWKEDLQEPGNYRIKFKQKAHVRSKSGEVYDIKPKLHDARGTLMQASQVPAIGNGSTLKIQCEVRPYTMGQRTGIRLNPVAVQIVDLVEYVPESAFGDSGGGFEQSPAQTPAPTFGDTGGGFEAGQAPQPAVNFDNTPQGQAFDDVPDFATPVQEIPGPGSASVNADF